MLIFVKPAPGQLTAQCFQEHFHSVSSETEYIFLCLIIDPWPRAVAHSDPLSSGLNTNSTVLPILHIFTASTKFSSQRIQNHSLPTAI